MAAWLLRGSTKRPKEMGTGMHTLKDHPIKRKRGFTRTSEDLRLLRLLLARRSRLEGEMGCGWNYAHSLELDLLIALEDRVLSSWARRLGVL